MANNRRQRRQGVVYGPSRMEPPPSEGGAILGKVFGIGVVGLAVGLLVIGAMAFLGNDDPGSPATPTRASLISPSPESTLPPAPTAAPSESPSPVASPTGEPSPGPSEPAGPSPSPTFAEPPILAGPGFVTFGTQSNDDLQVPDPATVFAPADRMLWSAYLTEMADSADLRVRIFKLDGLGGETLLLEESVTPAVEDAQIFLRRFRPRKLLDGPGLYAIRYVRGEQVMSEGFLLVR